MGGGNWTRDSFSDYTTKTKRMSLMADGSLDSRYSHQDIFKSRRLDSALDPKNVLRECCDSEEHPNTFPVILALDVTGSMGDAAAEVAKKLGIVMTDLYEKVPDIEFMIMAIGDTAYDNAPIQASQFESDIRIAQQLDKVYFESGGGGNSFESYTAAWYFGIYHCVLDCWKRGKKGLIITMGDEMLNPFLDRREINHYLGDPKTCGVNGQSIPPVYNQQKNSIETSDLYEVASAYYDICHIQVEHGWHGTNPSIPTSFKKVIGDGYYYESNVNGISDTIIEIIMKKYNNSQGNQIPVVGDTIEGGDPNPNRDENQEIGW